MATLREAAIGGAGIASLPLYILRPVLLAELLVPVLPEWHNMTSTVSLLSAPRSQTSRLATAFSDYLADELEVAIGS